MFRHINWLLLAVGSFVVFTCMQAFGRQENSAIDSASLKSVAGSVASGNREQALDAIRAVPADQRQSYLSAMHQMRGGQAQGGGAIADYTSLMQLIESTIDGDWASAGGTSQLMPYRNGVRIDPSGVIERFDPNKSPKTFKVALPTKTSPIQLTKLGEWQEPSPLRWISLHQLDDQIADRTQSSSKSKANIAMEVMGGLYRIDYVAFDPKSNEWLLGGPAGDLKLSQSGELTNVETGLPPVLLEDLLSIAPHVLNGLGEFGCTIDPDPKKLADSYSMAQARSSMRALQRNPEFWVEQWRNKLGRQHTKVIGIPQDSPAGYALIVADAHMKRLGLELETLPNGLKSYWHQREIFGGARTDVGLVRWWFSLTDHKIPMDPDRKIYHFASSNVQVLSEAQMMNAQGNRVAAINQDIAADAFAKDFTQKFSALQRQFACYGRLRHIFDLAVALEIIRVEMQRGNGRAFTVLTDPANQPAMKIAPKEIESVASTHKLPDGTVTAIVSGGVSIELRAIGNRMTVDRTHTNRVDASRSNDVSKDADLLHPANLPLRDVPFWR